MVVLVPKNNKYPFLSHKNLLIILHNILIIFMHFLVIFKDAKYSNLWRQSSGHYSFFDNDLQYQVIQKCFVCTIVCRVWSVVMIF